MKISDAMGLVIRDLMGAYEKKLLLWGETHLQLLTALKMNVKDFLERDGLRVMH